MAAGVTQVGTSIFLEDNLHADADLDAILDVYSLTDIVLKGLASGDFTDLGTNPADRSFRSRASIINGDGAGTQPTTLRSANETLVLDAARNFQVSGTGSATRRTELGERIGGVAGKPGGKNGSKIVAANILLRGVLRIFGSTLRSTSSSVTLLPDPTVDYSEIINSLVQSFSTIVCGIGTANQFRTVYNVEFMSGSTSGTLIIVNNWGAEQAERITIECTSCLRFFGTAQAAKIRDIIFIGTPTLADCGFPVGDFDRDFIEPVWSGNGPQIDTITLPNRYLREWWPFNPAVSGRQSGSPKLANIPTKTFDKNGADLTGILYTNSEGAIEYNLFDAALGIFDGVIQARRATGAVAAWEELGPFTTRYNLDGVRRTDYLGETVEWNFPRVTGAYGDQLGPMTDAVKLVPNPSSGYEENRPGYT